MNDTTQESSSREKGLAPRPGDFPIGSLESRAAARAMLGASTEIDCICFPADDPPALTLSAERDAAKAVLCPTHGLRFAGFAPTGYQVMRRPAHLREDSWKWRSEQYVKAMKASFPADRWPAMEIREADRTVRFVLKDGIEILRVDPVPPIYDY